MPFGTSTSWRQAIAIALGKRKTAICRWVDNNPIHIVWAEYKGKKLYGLFTGCSHTSDGRIYIDVTSLIYITETMDGMDEPLRQFDLQGRAWEAVNDLALREAQQEVVWLWCVSHGEEPPPKERTALTVVVTPLQKDHDHEKKEEGQ